MKRLILTGGGTAGHVTPNIALIPELQKRGFEIHYIGSKTGIEKELIGNFDIPYYGISSGKLRRYFDVKNFTDPFRILKGYSEAKQIIKKVQPDVIFSKGGFVTVPVVKAASRKKVPCVLHESDISPGLANRLCIPSATAICANFPETIANLPENKALPYQSRFIQPYGRLQTVFALRRDGAFIAGCPRHNRRILLRQRLHLVDRHRVTLGKMHNPITEKRCKHNKCQTYQNSQ